jgi:anthranilate synthase component I
MDLAIILRTALIKDQNLYVQAGSGIVADSIPEEEWQETINKAKGLFAAVAFASQGLEI